MSLLVRDAREHREFAGALAAGLVALAATAPIGRLVSALTGATVWPTALIAGGALLWALRVAIGPGAPQTAAACAAGLGGALPVIMLMGLTRHGLDVNGIAALAMMAAAVAIGAKTFAAPGATGPPNVGRPGG
jgi:hypothetical protein